MNRSLTWMAAAALALQLGSVAWAADGVPMHATLKEGVTLPMPVKTTGTTWSQRLSGPGIFVGQRAALHDAEGNIVAKARVGQGGQLTFQLPVGAKQPLALVLFDVMGAVSVGTSTFPVQGMLAIDPAVDFGHEPWGANISRAPGNGAHSQYRIPALATNGRGEVVAVYDVRWHFNGDLGRGIASIDLGENISMDGGHTWCAPRLAVDVPNVKDPRTNARTANPNGKPFAAADLDIGDPCAVFSPKDNAYFVMGLTGGGLAAYGGPNNPNNGLALYRRTAGVAKADWKPVHPRRDNPSLADNAVLERKIFDALYAADAHHGDPRMETVNSGKEFCRRSRGILQGPGHGMVTTKPHGKPGAQDFIPAGTVVFPMQWFFETRKNWPCQSYAFAVYTSDGGKSWKSTRFVPDMSSQENSIVELDDGSWHMIAKCAKAGQRYHYRSTDGLTWERTPYGVTKPSQCVQGSIVNIGKDKQGRSRYAMAYSRTGGRGELMLYFGTDATHDPATAANGILWDDPSSALMIHQASTGGYSYNSLCMLKDGILGILYEANRHIYFLREDVRNRLNH